MQLVPATLYDGMTQTQIASATASWQPWVDDYVAVLKQQNVHMEDWPQHAHWNWNRKASSVSGLLAYQLLGIECDGLMQGLMLTGTLGRCKISNQAGNPLVDVHFLATAPWNLRSFVSQPRFGLVGKILIVAAVQISLDNGFRGRIGLHSLKQAESFYLNDCGMTDLGIDTGPEGQGLRYFETTPEQAKIILNGARQ